ncbi:MAG TPA: LLM class flavin-dependent oxidoreductase [Thermoanaerobaculia bacterium]|jgi:probable LLM family oxidoreductase|nr:LLM class flavin-dependent oxidoreductase [Thermoanaerobaculia bacterium]
MELGITTFGELTPDPKTGRTISAGERLRNLIEEIALADQVGLEIYAVGEHHRPDFVVSSPAVVLAAAAERTKNIRLASAVSVLSSDDPVRIYQDFATLDLLSNGRAEIMAGRGSFTESFPLFGNDLEDYDELFSEKLALLLKIRESERVTWSGTHRPSIDDRGVYPRSQQQPLPVWIAVGGTPQSAVRAGTLGLPMALAIIGGMPERFKSFVDLYREAGQRAGHDPAQLKLAIHSHGYVGENSRETADDYFPSYAAMMNQIGRERGWGRLDRSQYEAMRSPQGALLVGSAQEVIDKIMFEHELFANDRFLLHVSVGTLPHDKVLRAIELFGTKVAPVVRRETAAAVVS